MANVNVNRNITDQFYRYKMPRLIAKVEGKGNGIKTVIVNMTEIAKSLERPPTYPTKYFGCELGAQTQFDPKNERYIVNGSHAAGKLQDLLDGFIKRFVLCVECDNPETNLTVLQKKGMILQRCIACGHQCNVDMRHKLTTFILKNPPGSEIAGGSSSAVTPNKKDKRSKRGSKSKESDAVAENGGGGEQSPDANEHDLDLDMVQAEVMAAKQKQKKTKQEDEDDWGEDIDTSAAAVQQRMEELSSAAKSLALTDDVEKTPQERMDIFYEYVKRKKESNNLGTSGTDILAEAERLDVKEKAPLVLAELLFNEDMLNQVKTYRNHLLRFTHENPKGQKYLLGGFELLVGKLHREALLPKVPRILKAFYDNDIIDEEIIIDWAKKSSKKYVSKEVAKEIHDRAAPLIKWLQEADEEDSSSEEDVEVVYSNTQKIGIETVKSANDNKTNVEEDEDIDIDAI